MTRARRARTARGTGRTGSALPDRAGRGCPHAAVSNPPPEGDREVGPGAHARHLEPEVRRGALARLSRIEGQVRGIARMVEEERWCADVVVQIMAVQEALGGVARALTENHLRHCLRGALSQQDGDRLVEELLTLTHLSRRT